MSGISDVRLSHDLLDGQARPSPLRVRVLHVASRTVSLVLIGAVGMGIQVAARGSEGADVRAAAPAVAPALVPAVATGATSTAAPRGRTFTDVLAGVDSAASAVDADIRELRIDNARGVRADVSLRIDVPGSGATAIARLLTRMESDGIADVRVDSVTATPGGSRLTVAGWILPTTDLLPPLLSERRHVDVSVELAELTAEAGVELHRVETSGGRTAGAVQLRAAGTVDGVRELIGWLENDLSAPARIRTLRLERAASDTHVLDMTFLLRERPGLAAWDGARP